MSKPLRVALVGTAFMGRTHSQAWRVAPRMFEFSQPIEMAVLIGRDIDRTAAVARRQGWTESSTDWRAVVSRPDIDVVDICTPSDSHEEIAVAALTAGKHVLCEKPLANTVDEAERMASAARDARTRGILTMCGFSYRRTPALAFAREIIAEGRLGRIRHVRAQYLQDWLSDPRAPHTWRLDRERAGSGALGDIGAHIVDAAQWVSGSPISDVSAQTRTFVHSRPTASTAERRQVTVDDAVAFTASFHNGALGVFEATRVALGHRNANRIEINGEKGSISFDVERMNELLYYDRGDPSGFQGFRLIQVTEQEHPYLEAWWPAGHGLGYEHTFVHEVVDFVRAITNRNTIAPSFEDAAQVQHVLEAVENSAADQSRRTRIGMRR